MRWMVQWKVAWLTATVVAAVGGLAMQAGNATSAHPALRDLRIVWERRQHVPGRLTRSYSQIWRTRGDGSKARAITKGRVDHVIYDVSPNGKTITYWAGKELWQARSDGSHARRVPYIPKGADVGFAKETERDSGIEGGVSPDGRWLVETNGRKKPGLFLIDRKTKVRRTLSNGWLHLSWAPSGSVIAAFGWDSDPRVEIDKEPPRFLYFFRITDNAVKVEKRPARITAPVFCCTIPYWSVDGRFLCITGSYGHSGAEVWVYDRVHDQWQQIKDSQDPVWSPTGHLLLYTTNENTERFYGMQLWVQHVKVYDPVSKTSRQLTSGPTLNEDAVWLGAPVRRQE